MAPSLLVRGSIALLVPWFIKGSRLLAARSASLIPAALLRPAALVAGWLAIVATAALGLGGRALARTGFRVTAVARLSLLALGAPRSCWWRRCGTARVPGRQPRIRYGTTPRSPVPMSSAWPTGGTARCRQSMRGQARQPGPIGSAASGCARSRPAA